MCKYKLSYGLGSITFMNDKPRTKPFMARKYYRDLKRQVCIGTTATYEEAVSLLLDARDNPARYNPAGLSFSEVYAIVRRERFTRLSKSTQENYTAAYNHCQPLHKKSFANVTIADLQEIITSTREKDIGYCTQKKIKQVIRHMYRYAVKYGVVAANFNLASYIELDPHKPVHPKKPFNTRQINRLKKSDDKWAWTVIMLIYSGCRVSELLSLKKADVKLGQRYFKIRKSKTDAGIRAVPIHKDVLPYYEYFMHDMQSAYLISDDKGQPLTYSKYRTLWDNALEECRIPKHTPHDARHTLATMMKRKGVDGFYKIKILGHTDEQLTNEVYTHAEIRDLRKAIDKV